MSKSHTPKSYAWQPQQSRIVLAGANPVAVDLVCARLMGFDYKRLPILSQAMAKHLLPISIFEYDEVICRSGDPQFDRPLSQFDGVGLVFKPHFGWHGHVEVQK